MARLGCTIPTSGTLPLDVGLAEMASAAEQAAVSSLWVSDHVVLLRESSSPYPYSEDGEATWAPDVPWLEAFSCLAWLAANTTKALVGSAVLVLPQRHPVVAAKIAATIDVLSGGRLVLGVGTGWLAEEFEVLGWDFHSRGRRMDEAIGVMRACWQGAPPAFEGEFFNLPEGVLCYPRPIRAAGVPVLVGGMTNVAVRRAARLGDGWIALEPLEGCDFDRLERLLEVLHCERPSDSPPPRSLVSLIGKVRDEHFGTLERVAALGFDEVIVAVGWRDLDRAKSTLAGARDAIA